MGETGLAGDLRIFFLMEENSHCTHNIPNVSSYYSIEQKNFTMYYCFQENLYKGIFQVWAENNGFFLMIHAHYKNFHLFKERFI